MPLDAESIQKVKHVLASQGWNDVMRPLYGQRARRALDCLAAFASERHDPEFKDFSDDQLRAVVKECHWMLAVWENEVRVHDANRRMEEQLQSEENGQPAR